jgi:hypothetical protein
MKHDCVLSQDLPHRMRAVDIMDRALRLRARWDQVPSMEILVDGKLQVEGNLNAFTNPAIEAGVIHCRALLEFLGLCVRNGSLIHIERRKKSDIGIENFIGPNGPLEKVDIDDALARYNGDRADAERALLTVFRLANKNLAHTTQELGNHPEDITSLLIAAAGIPSLVVSYLYTPLGLPAPDYRITSRPRE